VFVIEPDPYLTPSYRISPFQTAAIQRNAHIPPKCADFAVNYLNKRFGPNKWRITSNGRAAIEYALGQFKIPNDQHVAILTTSGNSYISSCVTQSIEKFAKWTMNSVHNATLLFVNHEFGYVYPAMADLKKLALPIIEDCCTTFFSQDAEDKVGKEGTFSIYSFPKFFNIQIGGLIVSQREFEGNEPFLGEGMNKNIAAYMLRVLGFELNNEKEMLFKRKENFNYAVKCFGALGFEPRYKTTQNEVPSVLMLKNNGIIKDLSLHKEWLNKHGIQNSIFYGEDAFFIPCHQNLNFTDIDYFVHVLKSLSKIK
jgi:hypothetical protein